MIERPVFKAHLHAQIIPGEGVLLQSEEGVRALQGRVYEALVPLLDGRRTADELVQALAGTIEAAKVYYALMLLEQNGHIAEQVDGMPAETAAFWHGLGIDPTTALAKLQATPVAVQAVGPLDVAPLQQALEALGVNLTQGESAALAVVITDDYQHDDLAAINDAMLNARRPWLLVKSSGHQLWLGPLFVPGETGCQSCLARRLSRNPMARKLGTLLHSPAAAQAAQPLTMGAACQLAAIELAKCIAGAQDALQGKLVSLDLRTWQAVSHPLLQDPACTACGTPQTPALATAIELVSRKVTFVKDGGHRATTPEQTLNQYQHLVSPVTGVVHHLTPVYQADGLVHVYVADHNRALNIEGLDALKRSLRHASAGKGVSQIQAKTSALCEALERYSGERKGTEVIVTASFNAMQDRFGADVIHPNAVMRYSDRQFAERDIWNAKPSKFNRVPEPLDNAQAIDWTPVWSLTHGRHKYLPTQLLYHQSPASATCDTFYCMGCSNGNASGNHLEEAILQGFCELVERDAVALWWYNRLRKPGVAVDSFNEPYLIDLIAHYQDLGRAAWALDITSDLGIPTFVAISRQTEGPEERILFGLGCHLDARIALQRAFAEMNQMLGIAHADGDDTLAIEDKETLSWLSTATLANQPYMKPDEALPDKRCDDYPVLASGDLLEDIHRCRQIIEQHGMEMLVLEQTRADVQMPVAKVIVPGLRHFWARFAPGRLYDVPVTMGWLKQPLTEDALNPIAVFL